MVVHAQSCAATALQLLPPNLNPGAGRSRTTSWRKRNRAAGRPPVAVDISPVGSTRDALSPTLSDAMLCRVYRGGRARGASAPTFFAISDRIQSSVTFALSKYRFLSSIENVTLGTRSLSML